MVLLGAVNGNNVTGHGWTELWGLISPPTGTQTVVVTENKSTTATYLNVTAMSYIGVSRFGMLVSNYGTAATTTSGAIVSSTGSRVLTVTGSYNATLGIGSSPGTQRSDMPATPTANYTTLLVQDTAGAATVTNTSTYTSASNYGWVNLSVNLVAGNIYQVSAPMSLTLAQDSTASFVGNVWYGAGTSAMSLTASATAVRQPLGPPLRYVGPVDTTATVTTTTYAQADNASTLVTPAWLTQQITDAAAKLVTADWITSQVSNYLTQTTVTNSLTAYVPISQLGVSSGVAQVGSNGTIPASELPTLITNDLAQCYDATNDGTIFLPSDNTYTVTTNNVNEFVLANVVVPNPGYPWIAMPFAYVLGYSSATPSGNRLTGTGNFGYLTVTQTGETSPIYGCALCTDDPLPNFYAVTPSAPAAATPRNQPALQGGLTLQLSACNFTGSKYVFSGTSLFFFVLVVPAVGG